MRRIKQNGSSEIFPSSSYVVCDTEAVLKSSIIFNFLLLLEHVGRTRHWSEADGLKYSVDHWQIQNGVVRGSIGEESLQSRSARPHSQDVEFNLDLSSLKLISFVWKERKFLSDSSSNIWSVLHEDLCTVGMSSQEHETSLFRLSSNSFEPSSRQRTID